MKFQVNRARIIVFVRSPKVRRFFLALISVLLLAVGSVLWLFASNEKADKDFQELASMVQVTETTQALEETTGETQPVETEPQILPQYAELYEKNSDMFGWLQIQDTAIDYPVMHTPEDPEKYLHTNFEGEYSYPGVPFIDAACSADSDNLLIYAHNMPNGSMFRSLLKYEQVSYWKSHPTIIFNTIYEEQEYEVLAAFYDKVYFKTDKVFKFYQFIDAEDEADFNNAIAQFKEKSLYDTGVEANYGDQLITLVTCAYHTDNGRFVVVARRK